MQQIENSELRKRIELIIMKCIETGMVNITNSEMPRRVLEDWNDFLSILGEIKASETYINIVNYTSRHTKYLESDEMKQKIAVEEAFDKLENSILTHMFNKIAF